MPNKKEVEAILRDCLAADPALRKREAELRPIIEALLESKPDTRFSQDFADGLREMLAKERGNRTSKIRTTPSFFDLMKKSTLAFSLTGGVVFVALLAVLLTDKQMGTGLQTMSDTQNVSKGIQIAKVGDSAFGPLSSLTATAVQAPMADGYDESAKSSAGASGNAGTATMTAPSAAPAPDAGRVAVPPGAGGGGSADAKMMMPIEQFNYRYVFSGELPAIEAKINVYRHLKGLPADGMLSSFGSLTAGLIDGSRFSAGTLQSMNIAEDREYGYLVNLDAVEGAISLSQNWQRWPHPENKCRDEACYQQYQMKPEQMPSEDVIIGIAEDFFAEYGIDRSALGKPMVNNDWRIRPMAAAADMVAYTPEVVTVTYPLLIDGKPAQDENGNPTGVAVNVNVRLKKVDGLWNLVTNRYEQSSYAAETDTARLLKFVSNGGLYGYYNDPSAKTVDIELGQPEIVLTSYWKDNGDGTGQNLYVPALRFAVLNPPADQPWFRKAITVPLSKDLLDQADAQAAQQGGGGVPTPLMLMRDDVKK